MLVTARWLIEPARRMSGSDVPVHFVPLGLGAEFRPVVDPSVRDPLSLGTYFHPAPHKGFSEALRVFELVRERHPVRVIVFGGARPRAPLPPWMTFHLLPRTPLPIYSAAAIWVHTSLHEGFGLPPAEAMASGCALAGFANAGVSEFAVDGQNSLLVAVGDIDGLAGAIVRLIENRQLRLRLAGQGSADLSVYTWERSVAAFEAALTAL
jgi:glycosyltransferase involved in cell wall biosynthesis